MIKTIDGHALLLVLALLCRCETRADVKQELFQRCLSSEGTNYLASVTELLRQPDFEVGLSNNVLHVTQIEERRIASILLARKAFSNVFEECSAFVTGLRSNPEVISQRPISFCGRLLSFAFKGPETEYIKELGERHLTENGWKHEKIMVKRYTSEEVAYGKARNAAAQLSLVEYYLKFSKNFSDYELIEMLSCLQKLESGGFSEDGQRRKSNVVTKDLIKAASADATRSIPVRIKALSLLPHDDVTIQSVTALMFRALQEPTLGNENVKLNYNTVYAACEYFKNFGTTEDLVKLKKLKLKPDWRYHIVEETIVELESSLKKGSQVR